MVTHRVKCTYMAMCCVIYTFSYYIPRNYMTDERSWIYTALRVMNIDKRMAMLFLIIHFNIFENMHKNEDRRKIGRFFFHSKSFTVLTLNFEKILQNALFLSKKVSVIIRMTVDNFTRVSN